MVCEKSDTDAEEGTGRKVSKGKIGQQRADAQELDVIEELTEELTKKNKRNNVKKCGALTFDLHWMHLMSRTRRTCYKTQRQALRSHCGSSRLFRFIRFCFATPLSDDGLAMGPVAEGGEEQQLLRRQRRLDRLQKRGQQFKPRGHRSSSRTRALGVDVLGRLRREESSVQRADLQNSGEAEGVAGLA